MVGDLGALIAALAADGIFYFTVPTPEFNNNVLQMPLWAWSALLFHRGLTRGALKYWLGLGGVLAALFYTKYSGGLLVPLFVGIALATGEGRRALQTSIATPAAIIGSDSHWPMLIV